MYVKMLIDQVTRKTKPPFTFAKGKIYQVSESERLKLVELWGAAVEVDAKTAKARGFVHSPAIREEQAQKSTTKPKKKSRKADDEVVHEDAPSQTPAEEPEAKTEPKDDAEPTGQEEREPAPRKEPAKRKKPDILASWEGEDEAYKPVYEAQHRGAGRFVVVDEMGKPHHTDYLSAAEANALVDKLNN